MTEVRKIDPMTLAELSRLTIGEPASMHVEIAVVDSQGEVALVLPVVAGDYWMMRQAHAFRLVVRLPAPPADAESSTDADDPASVEPEPAG